VATTFTHDINDKPDELARLCAELAQLIDGVRNRLSPNTHWHDVDAAKWRPIFYMENLPAQLDRYAEQLLAITVAPHLLEPKKDLVREIQTLAAWAVNYDE